MTSTNVDPETGSGPSIAIGVDGNPVIAFLDNAVGGLRVVACNDPACIGNDETSSVVDPGANGGTDFAGVEASIAIGADGNPVISHWDPDNGEVRVTACNDPRCVGSDETTTVADAGGNAGADSVGYWTSLTIGTDGNPVIGYWDNTNLALRVTVCNDPRCTGGDETSTNIDPGGNAGADVVGVSASITINSLGNPIISHQDQTNDALRITVCNDPQCAGGDETSTNIDTGAADAGRESSITIGTNGNPLISHHDETNDDLLITACNDPACAGGDETTMTVDDGGNAGADEVGRETSMTIAPNGNPIISHQDRTNDDLRLTVCNDPVCAGGDETSTNIDPGGNSGLDSVGDDASITIGANGNPIIAHRDGTNQDLRVTSIVNTSWTEFNWES